MLLGLVGLAQLAVAFDWVLAAGTGGHGHAGVELSGASLQHFAHESASWNLALGVGFLWVAWRSSRTSGVVPTLATFVVVLTVLELFDLAAGRVDPSRILTHGLILLGLMLVIVLDRRRPVGGSAPGSTRSGRCWASPQPGASSEIGPDDSEGTAGLRPTAQHRGTAVAIQHDSADGAQRRTA